jgi:TRAP-type C4-dicarboxylate transport system substrate-binding protein
LPVRSGRRQSPRFGRAGGNKNRIRPISHKEETMKTLLSRLLPAGLVVALVAFTAPMAGAQQQVYTLKFQHSYPPSLAFNQKIGGGFIELVERWSGGRIRFEVYQAGALASVTGMLEAVDSGVIDVGLSWGGFYSGDVPEADVEVGLPLAWQEPWEAYDAYYNRGLREVIAEAYESRFNVEHFPAIMSLRYGISTRQEISSLDDLNGLKIRAVGIFGQIVQELGASPTVIPGAELYTALQLGTIDGLVYGIEANAAQNLQEHLRTTIVDPNLNSGVGQFLINRDTWNSLPPDLQQVIEDATRYGNIAHAMDYAAVEAVSTGQVEEAGVRLLTLSEEDQARLREIVLPLWDEIAERSDLAARGVEIVKQQQREFGQLD